MNILHTIIHTIKLWTEKLWEIRLQELSRTKAFFLKYLRILLLTLSGFREDNCSLRASALTLYSLLSVVPVAATAFGIAKGFGFERILERQLLENIPGQEQGINYIIDFARRLLENTKGGVVAGIGVAVLFWTVMKVLGNIESSFNHIWKVQESRSFVRKFSDYLSIVLIAPILVILSSSVSVFITTQIAIFTEKIKVLEVVSPFILSSLRLLPYGLIWFLFSFMYIFMPNTEVRFFSGVLGGVIAGTIYQLVQVAYIYFQIKIANYNAIYGSFAALPFFVVWLQLSWLVVLLGAEISFHHQHIGTYQFVRRYSQIAPSLKKLLVLQVAHLLVVNFSQGKSALTTGQIAHNLELPVPVVLQILTELVESGTMSRISIKGESEFAYQPAKAINLLSIKSILDALEQKGDHDLPLSTMEKLPAMIDLLRQFDEVVEHCSANVLLKDIPADGKITTGKNSVSG